MDLMADWTQTVSSLVTLRRALGPLSTADPLALLATATTGAARSADVKPILAPSLRAVSATLADVGQDVASRPDLDRQREAATLNHIGYELVHWVRVRTPDDRAKAWMLAGETALDDAIHAATSRSAAGVALAAWQDALAAVQPVWNAPIVRRSVALGHLAILRDTHALVDEARSVGALPGPYADALLSNIRHLARAHQTTLSQIDGRRLGGLLKVWLTPRPHGLWEEVVLKGWQSCRRSLTPTSSSATRSRWSSRASRRSRWPRTWGWRRPRCKHGSVTRGSSPTE